MNFLTKIADFLGGGTVGAIADTVKTYFPPSMSDKEQAELSLRITEAENSKNLKTMALVNEGQAEFNKRITDLEGTAADLKTIPIVGHTVIFLRGSLRPFWGWFCAYADYMVFSKSWTLDSPEYRQMLFALNILVFVFIFGERAVKAVMPFLKGFLGKK